MRTISREQIIERVRTENPWWRAPHAISPGLKELRPRAYLAPFLHLIKADRPHRAVVLLGPRRVGKTVLLHHSIQDLLASGTPASSIWYLSVDHPIYNGLGLDELLMACKEATGVDPQSVKVHVFFDEIQYLRAWETHLKALVDRLPTIKVAASGSAAAALKLKSAESGAGRFTDFLLPPLTFHEYMDLLGKLEGVESNDPTIPAEDDPVLAHVRAMDLSKLNEDFIDYLNFGGYPEAIFSPEIQGDPARFIKSDIIDKVLLRDLPSLYGIQDIQELNYLFTTLAYNTAGEVSLGELSKGSGVAKNTLKRYIEYLEAAFLVKTVQRIDRSARRFTRAPTFKVYLTNPSMRAALFTPLQASDEAVGPLAETAVFSQWFHSDQARLHYARWDRGEVDIVSLSGQEKPAWVVEVKWSDRFVDRPAELGGLIDFCHQHNLEKAMVTTVSRREEIVYKNVHLQFIPAAVYCFTVGYNVVRNRHVRHGLRAGEPIGAPVR